jgi:hypothetical protein
MNAINRKQFSYFLIPRYAARFRFLTPAALTVFAEIYRCTNGGQFSKTFQSPASLAKRLHMSERTAFRALRLLERSGLIAKIFQSRGGRGIANAYALVRNIFVSTKKHLRRFFAGQNYDIYDRATNLKVDIYSSHNKKRHKYSSNGPPT